ncbi:DcaP family trimeric outer membrane transporter [Urechidicola sp. KH5]
MNSTIFFIIYVISITINSQTTANIYGHVMVDMGYNTGQINPDWFDVLRPTQLSSFENQYAPDGEVYYSVRQSRFGTLVNIPTKNNDIKLIFEWELFGVGSNVGETAFRLRHAYIEYGKWGVGQTNSPFMDMDVFPNTLEYWGPNAMVFFRNIQLRYMPIQGETRMTLALERPGASADGGIYTDAIALTDVRFRFMVPDLSIEYRQATSFGYVELAGILRYISWEDASSEFFDLSGNALGWGLNLSSQIKINNNGLFKFQSAFGEGIQNYINDAGVDIGVVNQPGNVRTPIQGEVMPVWTIMGFYDHNWNSKWSSSLGFGYVNVDVSEGQDPSSFRKGQYALLNTLFYPIPNFMTGIELQYGARENFSDNWSTSIVKVQASIKYSFDIKLNKN